MLPIRGVVVYLLVVLVSWPFSSQAETQPSGGLTTIRYARLTPSLGSAYFDLALEKGFFKRQNIELKLFNFDNGGTEAMAAVAAGQIDAGGFGTPILLGIARRIPIRIVGSPPALTGEGGILVAKNGIKSVKELKGKLVAACTPGTGPHQEFLKIVKGNGMSVGDFQTAPSHGAQAVLIMQSGRADGVITSEPYVSIIERGGWGHPIAYARDYNPAGAIQTGFIFASIKFIKTNPEAIRALLKAEVDARIYARDHLDEVVSYAKKRFPNYDQEVIRIYYQKRLKEWDNIYGAVNKEGVRNELKLLQELGDLRGVDIAALKDDDLFDLRFLPDPK